MGSRSGALDPGIILYLQRYLHYTAEELFNILNNDSGLQGLAGSNDMRQVMAMSAEGNPQAQLALEVYIHSLKRYIGAMLAVLGGCDAIIFTGGIGQHSSAIRAAACSGLEPLGIVLDKEKNHSSSADAIISAPQSTIKIATIAAEEEWCMAWTIVNKIPLNNMRNSL
jgi:acetate kinase